MGREWPNKNIEPDTITASDSFEIGFTIFFKCSFITMGSTGEATDLDMLAPDLIPNPPMTSRVR